jgi:epoxide hydrolase-like predicted phosphatase
MIKAIIFDFFGVLVTEGFKKFRDEHFPGDDKKWQEAVDLVNLHDSGQISKDQFIQGLADISGESFDYVAQNINSNQPNRLLVEYIRNELKLKYKIGLLSNSGDNYLSQMFGPKDVELFDDVVLSYRFKMIKPLPEIFELAAKRLGIQPSEAIFIDDSSSHCDGAQTTGMKTILYKDFPSFKKEIEQALAPVTDN